MAVHEKNRKISATVRKCALADMTNHVPLLMGVKYAVTSEVPISVSVPADAESGAAGRDATPCRTGVSIVRRSQNEYDVEWPIGFTFTEGVSSPSRTYAVGVVPYDPGGTFDWGGAAVAQDGGTAVRSRVSAAPCGCASGEGRTLAFDCTAECPCGGGCSAAGAYALEGASFAVTGGVCRCGLDDPAPWRGDSCSCGGGLGCSCLVCVCRGADAGPGLSVSFGHEAVIFEEAYEDAPGAWRPKRSTRTTLSVSARGGPDGGRLALAAKGFERLAPVACGPLALPPSLELAAGETYSAEFLCEAGAESAAANDVAVEGAFVENGTGKTFTSRAALTVVRVAFEPILTIDACANRHVVGVREEAVCIWKPMSVQPSVEASADADIGLHSGYATYTAPLEADARGLQMSFAGTAFGVGVSVVEPGEVFVKGTTRIRDFGLALDRAGGVGMSLDLHIAPGYVSFSGIAVQEIPSDYQDPGGYFSNPHFAGMWSHTVERGAGDWHNVSGGNFFMSDNADLGDELPRMGVDGTPSRDFSGSWTSGRMNWKIPVGWNERNSDAGTSPVKTFQTYWQQFVIDRHGTVKVAKLNRWVQRGTNGVFTAGGTGQ